MAAVALGRKPTVDRMKVGLAGNLCRCTGYSAIYKSIAAAARGERRRVRSQRGVKTRQRPNRG
jgi:aerobic-type carbon monoxide dehydrogenase small subunit (CoxS/CutS family)